MPVELPITRYSGSKRKLVEIIWNHLEARNLNFNSVLDIFGGTGIFSYYAKAKGKEVTYNDIFRFNCLIAQAIIGNNINPLTIENVLGLLEVRPDKIYNRFIEENFSGIYYPDDENRLIDIIVQNIDDLETNAQKASGFYLLFQACLIKRPYNLFHRKNLNLRTNFSGGGFGNKVTWEKTFEELFVKFSEELTKFNFEGVQDCNILNTTALNCNAVAELVYIDPPYFQESSHVTYHSKYHFLEGLANYDQIPEFIVEHKTNKEISINNNPEFENKKNFKDELRRLINLHENSIIVVSYRNNGIPSIEEISEIMQNVKNNVEVINLGSYNYALSRSNNVNEEVLIIGT
ncbi:DNA adenine methylase [Pedobacter alluvionis]|uniref:site-specific DNA-methyltransferase (adenine-specific) n=1 Tax=Pedobacter alluvionis TaxID=475253 RepID=A0A497Y8P4_9SPHI|nr:DNA adenine methylase [Pedobacter alluvionis]RLJ77328.1 adenine-specific DNA-methyltransferase [Pedobacter alluvionis]TFB33450.1 DNA methyltransferase [Pedobacter alluvionis]